MNFDVNEKVEAIKSDISKIDDENIDDYDGEEIEIDPSQEIEIPDKKNNNKDFKKKMIFLMAIIGGGMILLLLILLIVSSVSGKNYSYDKVEEIMKSAAESYFSEHKSDLPENENQTVEIEVSNLVAAEKMKPLSDYLGDDTTCSGSVQVRKTGSVYSYTPFLDCGEKYSTTLLHETITNSQNVVTNGYGLYSINGTYVYRGENVNNYVQMDAAMWRIVKVNSDKTITMILDKAQGSDYSYDDRYNQSVDYDSGINNFATSRMKEKLDQIYKVTDKEDEYYILSKEDKKHLVTYAICVGNVSEKETTLDNSKECSQTIQGKLGLLTASDFVRASVDGGCTSTTSLSCKNYNYLAATQPFWLVTGDADNSSSAYFITGGHIKESVASAYYSIRPVITLDSNTLIKEGNGTIEKPYILR